MGWIKHSEDTIIPSWLKDKLNATCEHCGSPMENFYNQDGRCTNRRCSNNQCYGIIAARGDFIRKLLKYDGVGYAKIYDVVKAHKLTNHMEIIPFLCTVGKPTVDLVMYMRLQCLPGIDSEWERIIVPNQIKSLDELYDTYDGKWRALLNSNKESIYSNTKFVNLKCANNDTIEKPVHVLNIMITGTPNGYRSKDEFIAAINHECRGKIIVMHQKTKRQSGVDVLIREAGSTTRGKVEAAIKGGIPIMTSEEFIIGVRDRLEAILLEQSSCT